MNDLPLQTSLMIYEWVKKDQKTRKARTQHKAIMDQINKLRKNLPN